MQPRNRENQMNNAKWKMTSISQSQPAESSADENAYSERLALVLSHNTFNHVKLSPRQFKKTCSHSSTYPSFVSRAVLCYDKPVLDRAKVRTLRLPPVTAVWTKRRLYFSRWRARPQGFLGFSCFSTCFTVKILAVRINFSNIWFILRFLTRATKVLPLEFAT